MIRISLPQRKGGVGKTTLVKILAEWFSPTKRVLLVDFDDQCSLSSLYLPMQRIGTSRRKRPPIHPDSLEAVGAESDTSATSCSADIFYSTRDVREYGIANYDGGRLDILPADARELIYVTEKETPELRERIEEIIEQFFSDENLGDLYDIIIFDTAPAESALMRGAIRASTHTIIPLELEQQCVDGLDAMVGMVVEEQSRRSQANPLDLTALQVNLYRSGTSLHKGLYEQIKSQEMLNKYLSPILIPQRTAYAERDVRGLLPRSVFQLKPSDPARKIAQQWCEMIESKLYPEG